MEFSAGAARRNSPSSPPGEDETDLRKGPWTVEEDLLLMNYISIHGEGRWDSAARCAGLRRTGKSCRLRWLNYLRPDVRRGNITPQEQLVILELHSRWGNRWSKIAQQLPGRTDNEIKNYWRTRVQKHARQLRCDVNSKQFKDMVRHLWMPRLIERIAAAAAATSGHQTTHDELAPPKTLPENSNTVGSSPESSSSEEQQLSSASTAAAEANNMQEFEDINDSWIQETMDFSNDWLWAAQGAGVCDDWWSSQDLQQSMWEESLLGTEDLWLQKEF